jgi:methyl-accepting chemotaxis protein
MDDHKELLNKTTTWITELKAPLESISKNSESGFVKLGMDLQVICSDAETLGRLAIEALELICGGSGDKPLLNISDFEKESLQRLEVFRSEMSEKFPGFVSCMESMQELNEIWPGIMKIANTLKMVAFNFTTESSRTESGKELFDIFVKEMRALAERVANISRKIKEEIKEITLRFAKDFDGFHNHRDKLDNTSNEARTVVSESIRRVDEVMNFSLLTLRKTEKHSQKISSMVGDVVVAIQFHDIVRQRIEHIIDAFRDIKSFLSEAGLPSDNENIFIPLGNAYSILKLQSQQVKQIISEIGRVHDQTTRAFKEIAKEIEMLTDEVNLLGSGKINDSHDNSFNQMLSSFEKLDLIVINGERLAEEISETMKQTSISVSGLAGRLSLIEGISTELHIKSINALIMSKKLGQKGATLSILAQYVTEGSKDSDAFLLRVNEILKSIQVSAEKLNHGSLKDTEGSGYKSEESVSAKIGINHISERYEKFINGTGLAHSCSYELKKKISATEGDLVFLAQMKNGLEDCHRDMEGILAKLSPFLSKFPKPKADLARLENRYTMEIERGIHKKSLEESDGYKESAIKDVRSPENDNLGDNVEFF